MSLFSILHLFTHTHALKVPTRHPPRIAHKMQVGSGAGHSSHQRGVQNFPEHLSCERVARTWWWSRTGSFHCPVNGESASGGALDSAE
jgi:hypothetical protein